MPSPMDQYQSKLRAVPIRSAAAGGKDYQFCPSRSFDVDADRFLAVDETALYWTATRSWPSVPNNLKQEQQLAQNETGRNG